jgi:hypothetical protein
MHTTAHLNIDYHEGRVERLSLVFDAPSKADVQEIVAWLQAHGATIKKERILPVVRYGIGHTNGGARDVPQTPPGNSLPR